MSELKAFDASELKSFGASELNMRGGQLPIEESTFGIRASGNEAHIWAPPGATPGDEDWLLLKTLTTANNELLFDEYIYRIMNTFYGGDDYVAPNAGPDDFYNDGILMMPRSGGSFSMNRADTWAQTGSSGTDGWERYTRTPPVNALGFQRISPPNQTTSGGRINVFATGPEGMRTEPSGFQMHIPNAQFATWAAGDGYPRGLLVCPIGVDTLGFGVSWSDTTWPLSTRLEAVTVINFAGVPLYFNNIGGL
jgi:hypothetical protein